MWRGEKDLSIYESDFEDILILKVSILFLNPIIVQRGILSKENLIITKQIISNIQ